MQPTQNKATPADYSKVKVITKDAVLVEIAPFSIKGKWLNPLNPKQPNCQFFSDAQYDYYKRTNAPQRTCFKAIQLKYNQIKWKCHELKIFDNRPEINYPDNDRCLVWWLNGEEIKNLLTNETVDWFNKFYYSYYQS